MNTLLSRGLLAAALVAGAVLAPVNAGEGASHEFSLDAPGEIDLDTLWAGDVVDLNVTLTNPRETDFLVGHVATSCGCTVASEWPDVIPAGGSAELTLQFIAPMHSETRTSMVHVLPRDGSLSSWQLMIRARISLIVEADVGLIHFGTVRMSASPEGLARTLTLTNDTEETVRLTSIIATPEWYTVAPSEMTLGPGERGTLDVALAPPPRIGPASGAVRVEIDHERMPLLTVPLEAIIMGEVAVEPERVWMGFLAPDERKESHVRIHSPGRPEFEVTGVEISEPGFSATATRLGPGVYDVLVRVEASDRPVGLFDIDLIARTNDPREPEIRVDVIGTVRPR